MSNISKNVINFKEGKSNQNPLIIQPAMRNKKEISLTENLSDIFVTKEDLEAALGNLGVSNATSWVDYATRWDSEPVTVAIIAAGEVISYAWKGVTRYRLIPTIYAPVNDAFYTTFSGGVLSGLITKRND